jgi:hypothetical protein
MKKAVLIFCFAALSVLTLSAQDKGKDKAKSGPNAPAATATVSLKADATPLELAKAAVAAHGGDKFKHVKSITQYGSVELTAPGSAQSLPASYKIVTAGEKTRFEISSPILNLLQIYDGENLYTSMGGGEIPNLSKISLLLLAHIEQNGYKLAALPDKKKRRAFRVTTPENYVVDFYLDPKTAQVTGYDVKFIIRDREVTTAVEFDKFRDVEGVILPEKFSQRLEFGTITSYANFKAKEIFVNKEIADDVFVVK